MKRDYLRRTAAPFFFLTFFGCGTPDVNTSQPSQCTESTAESDCLSVCNTSLPSGSSTTTATSCYSDLCVCGFTDTGTDTCYAYFRTTPKEIECPTTSEEIKSFAEAEFSDEGNTNAN